MLILGPQQAACARQGSGGPVPTLAWTAWSVASAFALDPVRRWKDNPRVGLDAMSLCLRGYR